MRPKSIFLLILAASLVTLGGCSDTAGIIGEWDCGNKYVFSKQGWSAPGTPSQNLPFKIEKGYVFMETLARELSPMLKFHDGKLFMNMDGTGFPDAACTKLM